MSAFTTVQWLHRVHFTPYEPAHLLADHSSVAGAPQASHISHCGWDIPFKDAFLSLHWDLTVDCFPGI